MASKYKWNYFQNYFYFRTEFCKNTNIALPHQISPTSIKVTFDYLNLVGFNQNTLYCAFRKKCIYWLCPTSTCNLSQVNNHSVRLLKSTQWVFWNIYHASRILFDEHSSCYTVETPTTCVLEKIGKSSCWQYVSDTFLRRTNWIVNNRFIPLKPWLRLLSDSRQRLYTRVYHKLSTHQLSWNNSNIMLNSSCNLKR